ncbi:RHS repeat-associated protein [Actinokineospora baliensis]|uniref:DUF5615 family PIN-like protein n=1 Tax=Actinokineospora baliensis TaxID=547056 RepID=UPI0019579AEE|nr:DUF5615 family PIN-like protein [Actinokineospora baliensis]MBM7775947.1 RHS repeat-associated protein [Actinokineospora baliensis]
MLAAAVPPVGAERANSADRATGTPAPSQAGTLPVRVSTPVRASRASVRVQLAPRSIAQLSGTAVVIALQPNGGELDNAKVLLDYATFRYASGADLGSRLRLVRLPECVLTTPQLPTCQVQTPVKTQNDATAQSVSTDLALRRGTTVLAATGAADGTNGAFSASSLAPAESWAVSGNTGAFTWSYPVAVPPTASGNDVAPQVSLTYNSATVDGRTAATNNQSSWVGQGWSYTPGFIERTYRTCADDTTLPQAQQTADLCWAGEIVSMSLGGRATSLVRDDATGTWRQANDDGTRVEQVYSAANGALNGEHWRITTTDGSKFYFGLNSAPGRTTQDATNSTWTVPVYGPRVGNPCYNAAGFAQSSCTQGWRWNLDYVEDPHGNAAIYYYTPETNYYGANNGNSGVVYTRGGTLKRIEYGLRKISGSVYGSPAPAEVRFAVSERCVPAGAITCDSAQFTAANAASWPDTPQDQQCLPATSCANHSPSFWSTKRLTEISTWYRTGSLPVRVESHTLTQSFPGLGDPSLRLDQIVRTAYTETGVGTSTGPVVFNSQLLDNRVSGYNSQPAMAHWRLQEVATPTGGRYRVTYLPVECTATSVPTDNANNGKRCYPVYWRLPLNANPTLDYFHVYPVSRVELQDANGISPTQNTDYTYLDPPAWHYDDAEVTKPAYRTYGQFRGYKQVEVRTGNTVNGIGGAYDKQTLVRTTYFRGMHGDTLPGNQQRTASVTNSLGESTTDDNAFAGMAYESQTFLGTSGAQLGSSTNTPTKLATTGTRVRAGLPAATADIVRITRTKKVNNLAAGGVQTNTQLTRYDTVGRPVSVTDSADGITDGCTTTSYADNTTLWIRDRVAQVWKSTAACPTTGQVIAPAPIVSSERSYFDSQATAGVVATVGDTTKVEKATAYAGQPTWATTSTTTYDASGRVLSQKDALNQETKNAYTPADGGVLAQVVMTNAKNQNTTTTFEPARGTSVRVVDIANRITESTLDVFGRVTAVWRPGRSKSAGDTPNTEYTYLVRDNGPLALTERNLVDYSTGTNYVTSVTLTDAFGRTRQVQKDDVSDPAGVTKRVVNEVTYDSHGWAIRSNNRYVTTGVPSTTLITVPDASVDDRTVTTYDPSGRPTTVVSYQGTTAKATTTTVYGGDRVTTFPAVGGVTKATVTDALGREVEVRQYLTQPTVTGNVVSGGTAATSTFRYNDRGQLDRVTDAAGNKWEYQFDFLGRKTVTTDPDAGQTTDTYDLVGQVTTTTDARGQVLSYDYDVLGRRTAQYSGSGVGKTTLATWVYDTATGGVGKLTSSTRYTANGNYLVGVGGYNSQGLPQNQVIQLPTSETGFAGFQTTTFSYTTTGQLTGMALPTKGGLPGEALSFTVDKYGNRLKSTSAAFDYVSGSVYNASGEAVEYQLSSLGNAGKFSFERDPRTHRLSRSHLSVQRADPLVDDLNYTYDAAGNLTKIVNYRGAPASNTRTQCFGYDSLARLSEAWTSTDNCVAAPSTSTVGGPDPYWTSWTINQIGLRTNQTKHGIGQADTITNYTYPAAGGTRPHSLTSTTTTGPGATTTAHGYDNAGNTSTRTIGGAQHTLTWNEENRLTQVQSPTGTTGYVYDADGNQLIRREPGKVILYLPGQEWSRDTATGVITGTRYYTHNGTVVARRVGGANPEYLQSDHHNTTSVSVSAVGFSVTRREMDPYGNQVGATQGGTWADNHGFLNMPANTTTGLVDIGARNYDPATGRFVSVDPVQDFTDPQSWTGYAYANNSPATFWDPTGLWCDGCGYQPTGQLASGWPTVNGYVPSKLNWQGQPVADVSKPGGAQLSKRYFDAELRPVGEAGKRMLEPIPGYREPGCGTVCGVIRGTVAAVAVGAVCGTTPIGWFGCGVAAGASGGAVSAGSTGGDPVAGAVMGGALGGGFSVLGKLVSTGVGKWAASSSSRMATVTSNIINGSATNLRNQVINAVRNEMAKRAGFSGAGQRYILDANLSPRLAEGLRGLGYNVRSLGEMGVPGSTKDPAIYDLAKQLGAKVITHDRGRQMDGGFFELAVTIDNRVSTPAGIARLLEGK